MQNIIEEEKSFIGVRLREARRLLSLSQDQLAKATGMSKGTIAKIEAGQGFTGDYLLSITHFFGMSLSEFANPSIQLPTEMHFRERIHEYHRKHKSVQDKILNSDPTLISLIEFRLKDSFLQQPRTVNEVIEYCKTEYNATFKSSVVSQALINAVKNGWLKRKSSQGRYYLYLRKKG